MSWKCPNCETVNQGQKCIVCGSDRPKQANKKNKNDSGKPSVKVIIFISVIAVAVVGIIVALAIIETKPAVDTPVIGETTDSVTAENTEPLTDNVSEIEPPVTKSPVTEPQTDEPSVTEPPVTEPIVTETPIEKPPVTEPPVEEPSETEPPEIKAGVILSVKLNNPSLTLKIGDSSQLIATLEHTDTGKSPDTTVQFASSNTTVASVSTSGIVTAHGIGSAVITCTTSNGLKATCNVVVNAVEVSSVTLAASSISLSTGENYTLNAVILPSDATDKTLKWSSSDTNIATVINGVVSAKSSGNAVITAAAINGKSASCTLTVTDKKIEPTSVSFKENAITLKLSDALTLNAVIAPESATEREITWSSSDKSVAEVSESGVVTLKSAGRVTITAETVNGKKAACIVTITLPDAESITLDKAQINLNIVESYTLTAVVSPENAADKSVIWKSSDESVCSIENGKLTALAAGDAVITVSTTNGMTASCIVTVIDSIVEVTSVSLDSLSMAMLPGDLYTFTAAVLPENAADKSLVWSSSNNAVVTFADINKGSIIALTEGTAVITATAVNGKSASCTVTVKNDEQSPIPGSDFTYIESIDGVIITSYTGTRKNIIIPATINGKSVVRIETAAFFNKNITGLTLPDSVSSIGETAFAYCSLLTDVKLGSSLTSIGKFAFIGTKISSVSLPSTLTAIDMGAFAQCLSLNSITVAASNPSYVVVGGILYDRAQTTLLCVPAALSIPALAVPNGVVSIAPAAFYGCANISTVTLPETIKTIGQSAFYGSSVSSVTLPSSLTSIGDAAFSGCNYLTSVVIPDSITSIGQSTFENCLSLTAIQIGAGVTSIASDAFTGDVNLVITCPTGSYAEAYAKENGITVIIAP